MKRTTLTTALTAAALLSLTGCANYYKVTDPASGTTYYTKDIDHERGGAVSFTDERTGTAVTIQNSEVSEISKDTYKQEVGK